MKLFISILKILAGWAVFYVYIAVGSWLLFDSAWPMILTLPIFLLTAVASMTLFDYLVFNYGIFNWTMNSAIGKRARFNGLAMGHKIRTDQPLNWCEKLGLAVASPIIAVMTIRYTHSEKYRNYIKNKTEENEREYQELLKER